MLHRLCKAFWEFLSTTCLESPTENPSFGGPFGGLDVLYPLIPTRYRTIPYGLDTLCWSMQNGVVGPSGRGKRGIGPLSVRGKAAISARGKDFVIFSEDFLSDIPCCLFCVIK